MEEAKTLVHHALTAMFAVLILGAVMGLITLGHMMWSAFSNQDAANTRLREYAKYSAFDGTTVRGQEIVALLHDTQGSPWVLIADESNAPINIIFTVADASYSFTDPIVGAQVQAEVSNVISHDFTKNKSILTLAKDLSTFVANIDGNARIHESGSYEKTAMNFSSSNSRPTYSEIQEWFLERGAIASKSAENPEGISGYLPYKSYLVYEDSVTTDIIGIILVEQTTD